MRMLIALVILTFVRLPMTAQYFRQESQWKETQFILSARRLHSFFQRDGDKQHRLRAAGGEEYDKAAAAAAAVYRLTYREGWSPNHYPPFCVSAKFEELARNSAEIVAVWQSSPAFRKTLGTRDARNLSEYVGEFQAVISVGAGRSSGKR